MTSINVTQAKKDSVSLNLVVIRNNTLPTSMSPHYKLSTPKTTTID